MTRRPTIPTEEELEGELLSTLAPVRPNPEFVNRLKRRLTTEPVIVIERRTEAAVFVVLALSLFTGALLVWLIYTLLAILRRAPRA